MKSGFIKNSEGLPGPTTSWEKTEIVNQELKPPSIYYQILILKYLWKTSAWLSVNQARGIVGFREQSLLLNHNEYVWYASNIFSSYDNAAVYFALCIVLFIHAPSTGSAIPSHSLGITGSKLLEWEIHSIS